MNKIKKNKEKLKEHARSCYRSVKSKAKAKEYCKNCIKKLQ